MKIALVSPFEERVPPLAYGGIELVVGNLAEHFVALGHTVTLLASGDSKTSARLVPVFPRALRAVGQLREMSLREAWRQVGVGRVSAYLAREHFDIIHNHLGWSLLPMADMFSASVVTTLHGPLDVTDHQEMYHLYRDENYVSISRSQRRPLPGLRYVGNVYNGIETKSYKFSRRGGGYLAFLGRISPEKGPVQAIEVAKRTGLRLVMAAKVDPADTLFFRKKVEPLIDGKQVVFLGEVGHRGKVELLTGAKALVSPIQWEEPFGLVFIEAMACGTPVLSFGRGSVPEIVENGVTGFVCETLDEMVRKVSLIDTIDRRRCVDRVRKYFSARQMALGYLDVYRRVMVEARWKQKQENRIGVSRSVGMKVRERWMEAFGRAV